MRSAGALRIDHVMGLLRLFWVPPATSRREGTYVYYPLRDLLGILALESQRNQCMVIGEDLGTVPEELRAALRRSACCRIGCCCSRRRPMAVSSRPRRYPRQALVAASTHDLPTLRGFWVGHDLDVRASSRPVPLRRGSLRATRAARRRARAVAARAGTRAFVAGRHQRAFRRAPPDMTPELALAILIYLARTPSQGDGGAARGCARPARASQSAGHHGSVSELAAQATAQPGAVARKTRACPRYGQALAAGARHRSLARSSSPGVVPPRTASRSFRAPPIGMQFNRDFTFAQATQVDAVPAAGLA